MPQQVSLANPTEMIDLDFAAYLQKCKGRKTTTQHVDLSPYIFNLDAELSRRIGSIGLFRELIRSVVAADLPIKMRIKHKDGIEVGVEQFPAIHQIGSDIAQRFGITPPAIYVYESESLVPFSFTGENEMPMIVLPAQLLTGFDTEELTFIIGHECGHIHNDHGFYHTCLLYTSPSPRD